MYRKVPYVEIINDPRYTMAQARDIFHCPTVSLSQYDFSYNHNKIGSYENQDRVPVDIPVRYACMESLFLIGRDYPDLVKQNHKNIKLHTFGVILNEGSPSRYSELKKWVLDRVDDTFIYGKWDEKYLDDKRFKGSLKLEQCQEIIKNTKYTFIIPIAPGWCTSKYLEMIHAGCVPFFHPDYDTQNHSNIQEFLRVSSPEELIKKINMLEEQPHKYIELLEHLQEVIEPFFYDGSFINWSVMHHAHRIIGKTYEQVPLEDYQKLEVFNLFSF